MHTLRHHTRLLRRLYSTRTVFYPEHLQGIAYDTDGPEGKAMPASPSYYSGRPKFFDNLARLEDATGQVRHSLKLLQLIPITNTIRKQLPQDRPGWKSAEELGSEFSTHMNTSRYRRVTAVLNELAEYAYVAQLAGAQHISSETLPVLSMFVRQAASSSAKKQKKRGELDVYGRSYTVGKRKTSSARVWMILAREPPIPQRHLHPSTSDLILDDTEEGFEMGTEEERVSEEFDVNDDRPSSRERVLPSTVLINNIPIAQYFRVAADRERVVRPLKIAGVLGKYNIFTLARGGGTTGQSGAIAHGIAKALVVHQPELETVLRKSKILWRDPRMVERKKTGLAKARKRYAWVRR